MEAYLTSVSFCATLRPSSRHSGGRSLWSTCNNVAPKANRRKKAEAKSQVIFNRQNPMQSTDWKQGEIFPCRTAGTIVRLKMAHAAVNSVFIGTRKSETNTSQ